MSSEPNPGCWKAHPPPGGLPQRRESRSHRSAAQALVRLQAHGVASCEEWKKHGLAEPAVTLWRLLVV
jgi:hypothetical protein